MVRGDQRWRIIGLLMRIILVVLLVCSVAFTPGCLLRPVSSRTPRPDPKVLVVQSGNVLFNRGSFRIATHNEVRFDEGAKVFKVALDTKIAADDRRFRMDTGPDVLLSSSTISDGHYTYRYVAETNQYTKKPTAKTPKELAGANIPGTGDEAEKINAASVSKIVRQETLRINGKSRACYVVESTFEKVARNGMTLSNGRSTTWVEKKRGMILKQISDHDLQVDSRAAATKYHSELTVTSLDLAPIFAADEFTFKPPAGAKQVDDDPSRPRNEGGR